MAEAETMNWWGADKALEVNRMAPVDLAWVAGVLDSSGTIGYQRCNQPGRQPAFKTKLVVAHKEKRLVESLQKRTGVGLIVKCYSQPKHMVIWAWKVQRQENLLGLLDQLLPLLVVKRERAEVMLGLPRKFERAPEVREHIWEEMRELNQQRKRAA